jgi:hypothetical protein
MPIEIRIEDGSLCPRVVCDVCEEALENTNRTVLWHREAPERRSSEASERSNRLESLFAPILTVSTKASDKRLRK